MCSRRPLNTLLGLMVVLGLCGMLGLAWLHAGAVDVRGAAIAAAVAGGVYALLGMTSCAFATPSPQLAGVHAIVLTSFWWLGGLVESRSHCCGPGSQTHWQRLAMLTWLGAGLLTAYAMVRMCLEDWRANARARVASVRRRRGRHSGPPTIVETEHGRPTARRRPVHLVDDTDDESI